MIADDIQVMNRSLIALLIAVAPAVLMAQLPEYVPSEGLEFWSNFDGDAEDESLQSVSSSIHGAQPTANRNGEDNKALAFDGQDDYVLLFENEGGTSFGESLTLAAWVRPAASNLNGTHSRIFNSTEGVGGGPDRWLFTWSPPAHEEKMQFQVDPSGSNGPYALTALSVGEWNNLAAYISNQGFTGIEGAALKATSGWNNNGNGFNEFGFSGLPGGFRHRLDGQFVEGGNTGYYFTSTFNTYALYRRLYSGSSAIISSSAWPRSGQSVRCIKD